MRYILHHYILIYDSVIVQLNKILFVQGLRFLSFLLNLINGHQWSLSNFEIIFEQWLTILVNVIDLSLPNCIQCINLLVNSVDLVLWESYHECLNRQVCYEYYYNKMLCYLQLEIKLKDHCHKMSVKNFIAVIDIATFEKSKVSQFISDKKHVIG